MLPSGCSGSSGRCSTGVPRCSGRGQVSIAAFGSEIARLAAAAAWMLMAIAFLPTLRLYRLSLLWAPTLPAIAAVYLGFTLDSAIQHVRGRGGLWKGRVQALAENEQIG